MRSLRVVAIVMLCLVPVVLVAQRPLRFGSLAPANSLWDKALKRDGRRLATRHRWPGSDCVSRQWGKAMSQPSFVG